LVNYAEEKGSGGAVTLIGCLFYNSGKSCIYLRVDDTILSGDCVTDCSGSASDVYAGTRVC